MKKPTLLMMLFAICGQSLAASDAELLYASLYGDSAEPAQSVVPVSYNSEKSTFNVTITSVLQMGCVHIVTIDFYALD
ncbi:hypothetical protein [Xenorhabdus budapestensis]|uniref:hypothetical protein n=1 Tax=Xenorhabdus budapestensis TaxID=290110 RepID=UPI001FCE6BF4|nr:hypothetical protein [Xenorhabdus budapestensis]